MRRLIALLLLVGCGDDRLDSELRVYPYQPQRVYRETFTATIPDDLCVWHKPETCDAPESPCGLGVTGCVRSTVFCQPWPPEFCGLDPCTLSGPRPRDIVIVFDRSGSMGPRFDGTGRAEVAARALREYVATSTADEHWWAIDVPDRTDAPWSPNPVCHQTDPPPLSPCADLAGYFDELGLLWFGGTERYYTALRAVPGLIDWRPGSERIVLFFGDEEGDDTAITEADVTGALRAAGIRFVGWTLVWSSFDGIAVGTGGALYPWGTDLRAALAAEIQRCQ